MNKKKAGSFEASPSLFGGKVAYRKYYGKYAEPGVLEV
jgi:hypothetical protein